MLQTVVPINRRGEHGFGTCHAEEEGCGGCMVLHLAFGELSSMSVAAGAAVMRL